MRVPDPSALGPCDCLYLAARTRDIASSCGSRINAERGRGLRVLLVGVFDGAEDETALDALLSGLGVDGFFPKQPAAPRRHPAHVSFLSRSSGRRPEDESCLRSLAISFEHLSRRVRAENVYLPLGVGGDVDRRLVHEAALEVFQSGAGRNVFLFEERPQALVTGAVRIRLSQVGARLPPGVAETLPRGTRLKYVLKTQRGGKAGPRGLERVRWAWTSAGIWGGASAWRPEKAFGLRLQPLLQEAVPGAGDWLRAIASSREVERLRRWGAQYGEELGRTDLVQRYWLLLPPREPAGTARLSPEEEAALG